MRLTTKSPKESFGQAVRVLRPDCVDFTRWQVLEKPPKRCQVFSLFQPHNA